MDIDFRALVRIALEKWVHCLPALASASYSLISPIHDKLMENKSIKLKGISAAEDKVVNNNSS